MVGDILQPTHLLFVLVVALLVLGPKRLPEVGRSLGRTMRDFRAAISGDDTHEQAITETAATPPAPAVPEPEAAAHDSADEATEPAEQKTAEPAESETATHPQPTATR